MPPPKIIYKSEHVAFVHSIPSGVEYWQFWLHKPEYVFVMDTDEDRIIDIYHRVPVVTNVLGAERYFPDRRYWEQYERLERFEVDECTAVMMTSDILQDLNRAYTKRLRGGMTSEQLIQSIDDKLIGDSIYDLPILQEQLNHFYFDPLSRHIYQYFVVQAYSGQGACSVKTITQIFDVSYQEAYETCEKLLCKGYIKAETMALETDWFIVNVELRKYWEFTPEMKKSLKKISPL